ncbi:MAG TPA: indole-3-glycerol phosphate synthase TrpC [Polyangiaceae bacterium]|nr:indole-3-glycerol phosphate synthase TrpC [Polyangiaceae bacterium]
MNGVLERIIANKRVEVEAMRGVALPSPAREPLDVIAALRRDGELALVAEVKRKSPSAGALSTVLAPRERAEAYARASAAMVSVLCDEVFFDGSYDHVAQARTIAVPLLAKEFVIDPVQVAKARAVGADAVLVIVRILAGDALSIVIDACRMNHIEPFVEVTDEAELARALDVGARVIGVNTRDLDTLAMDTARAQRVLDRIPRECVAVHLSGLRTPDDIASIASTRADAALVGEALMREDDPSDLLKRMLARARK